MLGRLLGGCLDIAKQPNGKSVGSRPEIMGCDTKSRRGRLLSSVFFSRRCFGDGKRPKAAPRRHREHGERPCSVNGNPSVAQGLRRAGGEGLATKSPRHPERTRTIRLPGSLCARPGEQVSACPEQSRRMSWWPALSAGGDRPTCPAFHSSHSVSAFIRG